MDISKQDTVSIIVRTCSKKRFFLLEEAIKSIINNEYRPLEIIIVIQSEDDNFINQVANLSEQFIQQNVAYKMIINPTSQDQRSKNLNLGLEAVSGRYVGFLDDDDIFYKNHIPELVNILRSHSVSWSFSDVKLVLANICNNETLNYISYDYPFTQDEFSLKKLFKSNFIPIHSYLLDTTRIESNILKFDESFTFSEDYSFILELATRHVPYYLHKVTCEYRIFQDFSNSNIIINEVERHPDKNKIREWSKALWRIEQLKEKLMPEYSSEWFSLKIRKYIYYRFPELKILLQYKFPVLRKFLLSILRLDF